ncbi:hypothetical protein [Aureimonas mangrovi]|uniref:hypothetical protein n=1 Tax=Aureimonas mangrovi TaxID=2758041 RepID=UPI001AEE3DA3|nr:hypothetical protein [Aureimonas mangrovi]
MSLGIANVERYRSALEKHIYLCTLDAHNLGENVFTRVPDFSFTDVSSDFYVDCSYLPKTDEAAIKQYLIQYRSPDEAASADRRHRDDPSG